MLEMARTPHLIRDVTVRPVVDLGVDAAIIFSDIMIPLEFLGVAFDIVEHVGPKVFSPIRDGTGVSRLTPFFAEGPDYVYEGIRLAVAELGSIPLIGFAGAPFTLASYLVEGGPSRTYHWTKRLMWTDATAFHALMAILAEMVSQFLTRQVAAGARAVQLFDSWVGALNVRDFATWVLPAIRTIVRELAPLGVPIIYFALEAYHLLPLIADIGVTVVGVDWRGELSEVRRLMGPQVGLMGNLDPQRVTLGTEAALAGTEEILRNMRSDPRFIFNLGHGVPPETDPAVLQAVVQRVHDEGHVAGVAGKENQP
jgi:uroporphyrinogen decarboxylase